MGLLPEKVTELHDLLDRLCNNDLNVGGFQRLIELLSNDLDAQQFYIRYTDMNESMRDLAVTLDHQEILTDLQAKLSALRALSESTELENVAQAEDADFTMGRTDTISAKSSPVERSRNTTFEPINLWGFASARLWNNAQVPFIAFFLGAILASGAVIQMVRTGMLSPPQQVALKESQPLTAAVAYLTSASGCNWGNATRGLHAAGSGVSVGDEIALNEGVAEFRLANGVYISVEGPAGLVLTSSDSMVLQYGKITTQIPWSNKYRIMAGACRLTASDAEFGVSLTGNRIDTHVFEGEVLATNALMMGEDSEEDQDQDVDGAPELFSPLSGDPFVKASISEGRSLALTTRNGTITLAHWSKAEPSIFATKLNMAGPLPISKAYVNAVLESRPKTYWRFESGKNGVVNSEVSGGSDLSIVGDVRLTELSGNRVAELPPSGDCYLCTRTPMDELTKTDYSFEIWVKPSHVHYGTILGLCSSEPDTKLPNSFLLEVQSSSRQPGRANFGHPNSIRFLHRDPPTQRRAGTNCFSRDPYSVRRWQHVVAVKHGAQMELYVDGKLQGQSTDESPLPPGQILLLGRQEATESTIQFIGQLDEAAVYSRALTPNEIKTHYELIDWEELKKPIVDPNKT